MKGIREEENTSNTTLLSDFDSISSNEGSEISGQFFENKIVPIWVSTKIAASILRISPNALRIRKCRGEVECKYFGKELRFNVTYLHSLFQTERVIKE